MSTKNKLGNPALLLASSGAGQKAISDFNENKKEMVKATTSVIPFLVKTLVVVAVGGYIYYRYTNRFISLKENTSYPTSNITNNQASTRAETIYNAMKGIGNGFEIVKTNIAGLNYNGFIKLYNAFGQKQGSIPFSSEMNLIEWFSDQFNESELTQLRFLVNNMF